MNIGRQLGEVQNVTRTRYRGRFEDYIIEENDGYFTVYAESPSSYHWEPTPNQVIGGALGVENVEQIIADREKGLLVSGEGSYVDMMAQLSENVWKMWPRVTDEEYARLRELQDKHASEEMWEMQRLVYRAGVNSGIIELSMYARSRDVGNGLEYDNGYNDGTTEEVM